MAVSIAGVSTACSKDALATSAEAVRKTLAPSEPAATAARRTGVVATVATPDRDGRVLPVLGHELRRPRRLAHLAPGPELGQVGLDVEHRGPVDGVEAGTSIVRPTPTSRHV